MNFNGFNFNTTEDIYKEHCLMTKGTNIDISFLNYNRLKNEGTFQWPVPDYGHPGTPRLFTDKKFYTPSQKAIFNIPTSIENTSEQPNDNFPFILNNGTNKGPMAYDDQNRKSISIDDTYSKSGA